MFKDLIPISFDKIMQTKAYTVIVLSGAGKNFAIYTEASVGKMLQQWLTETPPPRPLTHELVDSIFDAIDVRIKQVVIYDVQDTVYYAKLFLEQQMGELRHIIEIDGRPSDCLTFALMNNAPIYCTSDLLAKVIPIPES